MLKPSAFTRTRDKDFEDSNDSTTKQVAQISTERPGIIRLCSATDFSSGIIPGHTLATFVCIKTHLSYSRWMEHACAN